MRNDDTKESRGKDKQDTERVVKTKEKEIMRNEDTNESREKDKQDST